MDVARRAPVKSGASMRGRARLTKERRQAIAAAAASCAIASAPVRVKIGIRISLLERFEEMCRRRRIDVPARRRAAILNTLIAELRANQKALSTNAANLVP
jgi:hypothetical protein